jgi:alkylhydroperoxidase family enzyme
MPAQRPQRAVDALERALPDHPEWLAMFVDILQGSQLGPNDGWFRKAVAQTRYGWADARQRLDTDGDGAVARREFAGSDTDFARLDRDGDGVLNAGDFDFSAHALTPSPGMMLFYRTDRDGNGKITPEEMEGLFRSLDRDQTGFLAISDLQRAFTPPRGRPSAGRTEGPSRWTLVKGLFQQEIGSLQPGPAPGEKAPEFLLKTADGAAEVALSQLIGPKPVVLIFGNFTCGPFRSRAGDVEKLYQRYKDRATFAMVYVREAHPTDGWSMESNDRVGVHLRQPRSYAERVEVAQTCGRTLGLGMPMLVDTLDDQVGARYSGMPSRLYLIDREGKVAYKSGRGPFGFKPDELEQSLLLMLEEQTAAGTRQGARVPLPPDAEAWSLLPATVEGGRPPLPNWAKALARPLPRTTAAMLDLDRLHRTRNPLGPQLRGLMRWVAADTNDCAYARAYAEADLRRAGVDADGLKPLSGDVSGLSDAERAALHFAHKMTLDASMVTDEEVAELMREYGPEKVAAMVLLLAHANFQDRLLLALDVPIERGGPLPPVEVRFARGTEPPPVPPRVKPQGGNPPEAPERIDDEEWLAFDFAQLQEKLRGQRARAGRIRVPTWEEVLAVLPPEYPRPKAPIKIQWSLVCMGYQPELAMAWSAATRAFGEEAKQDRVFEESLFWVVTRTIHCFY